MPSYKKCSQEVLDMSESIIAKHHKELDALGVTIDFVFAYADENEEGEKTGPAIVHNGYPADGLCKKQPLLNRLLGTADALILLDGDRWDNRSEEEQAALLDHEINHLEVAHKADGEVIRDKVNRPKLKMRLHDVQAGWFEVIAKRHGMASGEVQQAQQIASMGQTFMPFLDTSLMAKPANPALKAPKKKKE